MRVNSDKALDRAIRYREEKGGKSWLELTRDPEMQQRSRDFFTGNYRTSEQSEKRA